MTIANALLCPAYYFEAIAFNPTHQPKNRLVNELAARITALIAPFLYLYQICLHGVVSIIDLILCVPAITPGILLQSSIPSFCYSSRNFVSSACEIFQKILLGPHCQANYFGDSCRYKRIDCLSNIGNNLI